MGTRAGLQRRCADQCLERARLNDMRNVLRDPSFMQQIAENRVFYRSGKKGHEPLVSYLGHPRFFSSLSHRLRDQADNRPSSNPSTGRWSDVVFAFHDRDEVGPRMWHVYRRSPGSRRKISKSKNTVFTQASFRDGTVKELPHPAGSKRAWASGAATPLRRREAGRRPTAPR